MEEPPCGDCTDPIDRLEGFFEWNRIRQPEKAYEGGYSGLLYVYNGNLKPRYRAFITGIRFTIAVGIGANQPKFPAVCSDFAFPGRSPCFALFLRC